MRENKIFNQKYTDIPIVKILIHTDSFKDDLINGDKTARALFKMSKYEFLKIDFTPTSNGTSMKLLSSHRLKPHTYFYNDGYVSLKCDDVESFLVANTNKKYLEEFIHFNSQVKVIDIIASNSDDYDYFIVGKYDELHNLKTENRTKILYPKQAIELIRLLAVDKDCFYTKPNEKISGFYYYLYRYKSIFFEFQPAWTKVVYAKDHGIIDSKVEEQFDSLAHRLEYICRSADKVSIYSLKEGNNSNQANALYHFGYLVMLITGVYDDIAWIIEHIYKLDLHKRDVTLKVTSKRKLLKKVSIINKELYNYLTEKHTQELINLLYPIRDTLQHRQFIRGSRYSEQSGYNQNLLQLPEETVNIIKESSEDLETYGLVFSHSNTFLFNPKLFTSKIIENTAYIINQILSLIDWNEIIKSLPKNKIEEIILSNTKLEKGLWYFLGLDEEPLYF